MGSFEQGKWSNKNGTNATNLFDAEVTVNHACGAMNRPRKTALVVYKSKQWENAKYSIVAPLCSHDYYTANLLMEIKQVAAVGPVRNAFRQKGLMSSGRSDGKLGSSRGSNGKYPVKR